MRKKILYGLMGILSFLGFIGVFTNERLFLAFFGFIVHFQYFFIKSDEMLEEYINKSAATAFYVGMIIIAVVAAAAFFINQSSGSEALLYGLISGWSISVIVYGCLIAYHSVMDGRGLENDNKQDKSISSQT